MRDIVYKDGTRVPDVDLDIIFHGFGFRGAQHFEQVLAGEQPSALGRRREPATSPNGVTPAEFARQVELNRRHERRREAARRGRLLALARNAAEVPA